MTGAESRAQPRSRLERTTASEATTCTNRGMSAPPGVVAGAGQSNAAESESESTPPPAAAASPAVRPGGVGAGLATDEWWDQYYRQMHDEHWDWYLPNDTVVEMILEEARRRLATTNRGDDEVEEELEEGASERRRESDDPSAGTPASLFASPSVSSGVWCSLSVLQLGCGNSEVTRLLWQVGMRTMQNVDFSRECIERMRDMQDKEGWTHTATEEEAAGAGAAVAAPSGPAPSTFAFSVMDVRSLAYPSSSFGLAFGKGCLDCVVLESSDSVASGRSMLREVWRVLQPAGVSMEFSLSQARTRFWIEVHTTEEGTPERAEEDAEIEELVEVMRTDNPPHRVETRAWSEIRMVELDCSPLEMPNQRHTYVYIATKR